MIRQEGYNYTFDTDACASCKGKCCTGESGYIWVNDEEILTFIEFLGIKREEFVLQYLQRINSSYTLKEVNFKNGYACIFFDEKIQGCGVYDIRPKQCRTFPFWDYFKNHQKELEDECIGILPL
ncbi:MAG: YkgJ family cysteine cluster protein [Campylobacteraceae bacterium]|nr:YkgJ family cysteine cluster protein [Campylobacteraceae bacterium]